MSVTWEKGRGQVNIKQIQEFESLYKVSFPEMYKKIILVSNGGYPSKTLFDLDNGREVVFESLINWDKARKANFYFWLDNLDIENIVPFGKDPFGNLICFDFSTQENPVIKFWDHETNDFYVIAESFDDFLNKLNS